MENTCSLCKSKIDCASGYSESKKPLCDFCVVRYEILKTRPDFSDKTEIDLEEKENDLRDVDRTILKIITYQYLLQSFYYYKKKLFSEPIQWLIIVAVSAMFSATFIVGLGFNIVFTLILGLVSLVPLFVIIKLFELRKFHKLQQNFYSRLSVSRKRREVKAMIGAREHTVYVDVGGSPMSDEQSEFWDEWFEFTDTEEQAEAKRFARKYGFDESYLLDKLEKTGSYK